MQILFISERFPWPLEDGGNMRTFHVLKAICQEHDVTLLSHAPKENADESVRELKKLCRVKTIAAPSLINTTAQVLMRPGRWNEPMFILKNWSLPLFHESQRLLKSEPFDVVHFNHLDTAAFSAKSNWPKLVFDSHNCISTMAEQLAQNQTGRWHRWLYRRESKALAETEKTVCDRCDIVLACSQQDRESLLQLSPTSNVAVIANGADIANTPASSQELSNRNTTVSKLVFTGAMDYAPNVIGVEWFCNHVLPLIRQQQPRVLFQIVGRNPTARITSLHDVQDSDGKAVGVEVTGRVESVAPYLEQASAVVVPLLDGGGTRLKILEAFATKRPVVSTAKGAEGIDAERNNEILIADEPTEFASSVLRLIHDPTEANRIGNAGYELAKRNYDWQGIGQQIRAIYKTLKTVPPCVPAPPISVPKFNSATIESVNR